MTTSRIIPAPGHYIIRDDVTGKVSYWQGEYHQSAADRFGTSTADYIHAMHFFLSQAQARDVLMIGCGGGTLATMLHRDGVKTTVVDLHKFSFDIAHKYFSLPKTVETHVGDGIAWLKGHRHRFDAIVLDAFHGDFVPAHLKSDQFCALVREHLAPDGLFLVNLLVLNDFDECADRLARTMKTIWPDVRVLDSLGLRDRNAIVMAGQVSQLREPSLLVRPQEDAKAIRNDLAGMKFRRWKTSRFNFGD